VTRSVHEPFARSVKTLLTLGQCYYSDSVHNRCICMRTTTHLDEEAQLSSGISIASELSSINFITQRL